MWGRLGLQCLKTVKSEVIAMWVEWAKEMQVEKKKKSGTRNGFGYLPFFNAWPLFSAFVSRRKFS